MELQRKESEEEYNSTWYCCMDCEWEGGVEECEFDYDYDEFYGRDIKYPICPKCGGGVQC